MTIALNVWGLNPEPTARSQQIEHARQQIGGVVYMLNDVAAGDPLELKAPACQDLDAALLNVDAVPPGLGNRQWIEVDALDLPARFLRDPKELTISASDVKEPRFRTWRSVWKIPHLRLNQRSKRPDQRNPGSTVPRRRRVSSPPTSILVTVDACPNPGPKPVRGGTWVRLFRAFWVAVREVSGVRLRYTGPIGPRVDVGDVALPTLIKRPVSRCAKKELILQLGVKNIALRIAANRACVQFLQL